MKIEDLDSWHAIDDVAMVTDGKVTKTTAKKTFRNRRSNGLEERRGCALVGKTGFVHLPTFLDVLFNQLS